MKINPLIKIIVASILIYFLSKYNFLDFSILSSLHIALILKILILISIIIILGTLKWYFLLKVQNINISLKDTFESYYIGYALNYILFGIAGDIIKTLYLLKGNKNKIGISLSVIIDRAIGLLSMIIIFFMFLPQIFLVNDIFGFSNFLNDNKNIYYSILIIVLILLFMFIKKCLNSRRINKVILLFLYKYKNKVIKLIAKTFKILFTYRKSSLNLLINLLIAIFLQIVIGYSIFLIATDILSETTSFSHNLVANIAVQAVSKLPISPGGIGVGEAAFAQVMYLLNNNILLQYASVLFIFRIFNMIYSIPGVIIYYLFIKNMVKK
tara:strand:- start:1595 stop:2569 length:975 start_codon:yes stop_codon:yes gene_type:complete